MKKILKKPRNAGFALVVTLSLMILLTVIAVGLLSLASISLRSSGQGSASATARANARLAMMLALGDLQVALGPDKSVSAPASAVFTTAARPHLTGAWQSLTAGQQEWHWTPSASGSPTYSGKAALFKRWLVSTPTPADSAKFSFASASAPTGIDAVNLVGDPTVPLTNSQNVATAVPAAKIKVASTAQAGRLAWAVFDESTKASIDLGDPTVAQDPGLEIASRTVPSRFHADMLDSKLAPLKTPRNLISMETAAVPVGDANRSELRRRFHDFTTGSVGLLTNTASGGLKVDLTSLLEPSTLPNDSFVSATGGSAAVTPYPAGLNNPTSTGAPKWTYIRDHYRKYKTIGTTATGESAYTLSAWGADLKVTATGTTTGVVASPDTERLLPVIAKFQLVFSLVSHYPLDVGDRRKFLDKSGDPKGYTNYAVPDLAYDPVITLYNPYDVTLNLSKTRIRIWDPPVGFRFTKIDNKTGSRVPFRDPGLLVDQATGGFVGLARFQRDGQSELAARKFFTLILTDGTTEAAGSSLILKPGEVKVFSPRVQNSWNWAWETDGGYAVKTFFDYGKGNDFANQDKRTGNKMGLETVPGWVSRAGLQTDHLATDDPRYQLSKYAFESARNNGFVSIRLTDGVQVEAKPLVTAGGAAKQFQVDILAGVSEGTLSSNIDGDTNNSGVVADTLRSYRFNFNATGTAKDPSDEISADPVNKIITKEFLNSKIFQGPSDNPGLKKAFAMLEMTARTTKEILTDSKPWLYNNFVVEGGEQNTSTVGLTHQSYDLRLIDISSFKNFPDGISIDPDTNRGYFGANGSIAEGSSFVPMLHVPLAPAASLGDLIPTNLAGGALLPRVVHPFGNSRAHPLIPSDKVSKLLGTTMLDHSYLLNEALWDSYYFSTLTNYVAGGSGVGGVMPETLSRTAVMKGMLDGTKPALNNRLVPVNQGDPATLSSALNVLTDLQRSRQLAKYVGTKGPFNVNSTSVDAWRAVLSSLRERNVEGLKVNSPPPGSPGATTLAKATYNNGGATPFARVGKPLAGSAPTTGLLWAGYRSLTDAQISDLAKLIVAEIKLVGVQDSAPSLSLSEFVNRRPGAATTVHSLAGLLQTAIDKSNINDASKTRDSKTISASAITAKRKTGTATPEVMDGESAEGAPSMLTQGDLMAALAPVATVRGDTFKIRSYGEALAANGTTILARAWCEVVVQRAPDFVDPADAPETAVTALTSLTNQTFGRRFNIVSFRWLNEKEI